MTACYDSINHELLRTILVDGGISESCVDQLIVLIGKWVKGSSYSINTGIPQGPLASGIIGEAILFKFDEYANTLKKKYRFSYVRYVDDIRLLAEDEKTVRTVLFMLDKKSKELGLYPQVSKIDVHKIEDIGDEIRSISQPLFHEDELEVTVETAAIYELQRQLRQQPADVTRMRRLFKHLSPSHRANGVALRAIEKYPNLIHSFAYYVKRYPRKLPRKITELIFTCCQDETREYAAGLLLEAAHGNMNREHERKFVEFATKLRRKQVRDDIYDSRYKAQLILLLLRNNRFTEKTLLKWYKESNWWIRKELISNLSRDDSTKNKQSFLLDALKSEEADVALMGAHWMLEKNIDIGIIKRQREINIHAQRILKQAGIIDRAKRPNSQIGKFISEITGEKTHSFSWKKYLKGDLTKVECDIFRAQRYWTTDLTAFVNIWDSIDDRFMHLVSKDHKREIGTLNLGCIGSYKDCRGLKRNLPKFHNMAMKIHELRLESDLSHSETRSTKKYTGPISNDKRKWIRQLIHDGIEELITFW